MICSPNLVTYTMEKEKKKKKRDFIMYVKNPPQLLTMSLKVSTTIHG